MTGLDGRRVYLDWNATAPLRPEARAAMLEAMDAVGNPSSVHAEGRAAKRIVETARGQVARLVECDPSEVVFTSGATEAAAMVLSQAPAHCSDAEHDAVVVHRKTGHRFDLDADGRFECGEGDWDLIPRNLQFISPDNREFVACQSANSETGVRQDFNELFGMLNILCSFNWFVDACQSVGRVEETFKKQSPTIAFSGHKLGAPKGTGALVIGQQDAEIIPTIGGGGQEQGRRSGTENVIGIAGFGAAAEAALRDLESGVWLRVEKLRNILEERLETAAPDLIIFGREAPRLPNTSCFAIPGWRGETQVMQMDMAGFAISAGSACSSGKVNKASRVLLAMGFDETTASSAIRVSMGPTTTEAEVMAFADTWIEQYRKRKARAA